MKTSARSWIPIYPREYKMQVPLRVLSKEKMTHTIEDKQKLLNRVRRLAGQIEAVERAVEAEAGCTEIMKLLTAGRGAINSIMAEVVKDHIQMNMFGWTKKLSLLRKDCAE